MACVVQGASKGIGLAYVKYLLALSPTLQVIGTSRTPAQAVALHELQARFPGRLDIVAMDIAKDTSIASAVDAIADKTAPSHGVQLLINSTGVLHPSGKGETSLQQVTREALLDVMSINAFGALLVTKHLAPLLTQKKPLSPELFPQAAPTTNVTGAVVNMSARVGSIGDNNGLGGWYAYRMSKCALNMATKTLALELARRRQQQVVVVSMHPSTVKTDFSRTYWQGREDSTKNLFTADESVAKMMRVVHALTPAQSGKFLDYAGKEIPY